MVRRSPLMLAWCLCDGLVVLDPWARLLVAGMLLGGLMGVAVIEKESICLAVRQYWEQSWGSPS